MTGLHHLPAWVLVSTTRYALGRRSYHPTEVADLLRVHWHGLASDVRSVILRSITEYLAEPAWPSDSDEGRAFARKPWLEFMDWARQNANPDEVASAESWARL